MYKIPPSRSNSNNKIDNNKQQQPNNENNNNKNDDIDNIDDTDDILMMMIILRVPCKTHRNSTSPYLPGHKVLSEPKLLHALFNYFRIFLHNYIMRA